jgi:hypothetical protein
LERSDFDYRAGLQRTYETGKEAVVFTWPNIRIVWGGGHSRSDVTEVDVLRGLNRRHADVEKSPIRAARLIIDA